MILDAHQHFWRYDPERFDWITEDMAILKRDCLPVDLEREFAANGVERCIAVQAGSSEAETFFLLDLAEQWKAIAGVVGWVDLCDPRISERLDFFSRFEKLRGFRHVAQSEPDSRFLMREDFRRGISELRRFKFTYDILIYPRQLPAALELVAFFPQQLFVIDHLAKPEIKDGKIEPWAAQMHALARHSNVYCKISGLVTEADWQRWTAKDFRPYLDVVFDAFGTERLMFGSDWPVCLVASSYAGVKKLIEEYVNVYPKEIHAQVFGETAARFYGIGTGKDALRTR
jgi:L-fuconolactonase